MVSFRVDLFFMEMSSGRREGVHRFGIELIAGRGHLTVSDPPTER
jgi:hypothetical protein